MNLQENISRIREIMGLNETELNDIDKRNFNYNKFEIIDEKTIGSYSITLVKYPDGYQLGLSSINPETGLANTFSTFDSQNKKIKTDYSLPVVWGQIVEQFKKWIDEVGPVLIGTHNSDRMKKYIRIFKNNGFDVYDCKENFPNFYCYMRNKMTENNNDITNEQNGQYSTKSEIIGYGNKKILNEQVEGIDQFISEIVEHYPIFDYFPEWSKKLKSDIEKSGCQKIEFTEFSDEFNSAAGAAYSNGVLINKKLLNGKLGFLLFCMFHELAHQYQFKKYGAEVLYDMYNDGTNIDEAAKYLYNVELIADEFGARKVREYIKIGVISKSYVAPKIYKNVPISLLVNLIKDIRKKIKQEYPDGTITKEQISELIYNMIKLKTNNLE